jgi:Fe(3+) dicitrate transport protein
VNWGAEARYLKRYSMIIAVLFLIGLNTINRITPDYRGPGTLVAMQTLCGKHRISFYGNQSDYTFPNLNLALFGENIFKISSNFSITPGFRFEKYEHKRKAIIEKSIKT